MSARDDLRAAVEALAAEWENGQAVGYDRNEQVELNTEKVHAHTLRALLAEHPVPEPPSEVERVCYHGFPERVGCFHRECGMPPAGYGVEPPSGGDCAFGGADDTNPSAGRAGEVTADELAEVIWTTSRADESAISATGANHVAAAILARYDVRRRP